MIKYLTNIVVLANQLPNDFVHLNTHENYLADVLSRLEYNEDGSIKINALNSVDFSTTQLSPTDSYMYVDGQKHIYEQEELCFEEHNFMSLTQVPSINTA